ncbi:MAG TPA: DUF6675 family protein [Rectinemataceae bacterium]|nr:DUF6675 family protein [Rectinemataceae bacterium]
MRVMRSLAALFLILAALASFAETGPTAVEIDRVFIGLDAAEKSLLSDGQPVIRTSAHPRASALVGNSATAAALRDRFGKLNPNYYGEFLYVRRFDPVLLDGLEKYLSDPRHFVGLPYRSKRNNAVYDLFDRMDVSESSSSGGATTVTVVQHMEPFAAYRASYRIARRGNELEFSFVNEGPLVYSYQNFKAAGPGDMAWSVYAFEKDGWLWFYGAGGVKAFDLFGAFRGRLEDSFMGRIGAFFGAAMKAIGG